MRVSDKKPDMTGWTEERKNSFECIATNEPETLDEVLEGIVDKERRKYFRDTYKKSKKSKS